MKEPSVIFTIPTYRLRDVAETIEKYDEHFWSNGHTVKMMVFDDSSLANHEKYYALLEQTKTVNDIYYVGPREKEEFLSFLNRRLRDKKLDSLVRNLFRPSYGGNRNFTLMYSLGRVMVSSDDDMRPFSLIEYSRESLGAGEVSRGRLHKAEKHQTAVLFALEEVESGAPLQATPLLLVFIAQKDNDKVRLVVIEIRQIDAEVRAGELRRVPLVVEDLLAAQLGRQRLRDPFDPGAMLSGARQRDPKTFRTRRRAHLVLDFASY